MEVLRVNRLVSLVLVLGALASVATTTQAVRQGINCRVLDSPIQIITRFCICQPCYVCQYTWTKNKCELIQTKDMDTSDGSEIAAKQPNLDAEDWFLTEDEITASRGGVARSNLSIYTSGNEIHTYAATNEFFDAVFDDFEATTAKDRIFMTAWAARKIPFKPQTDPTGKVSGFVEVVSNAVARGATFNALVWTNILKGKPIIELRDTMNAIPDSVAGGFVTYLFDDRVLNIVSSHHQKTLVFQKGDELIAYVGGIDPTIDRWDTIYHNNSAVRDAAGITVNYKGWLDGHLRIQGPAANDVAANFLERYNSDYKPTTGIVDDILDFENPAYSPLTPIISSALTSFSSGKQDVQIVRTFSCKYKHYKEFAPKGETSIFAARVKAIKNAQNYIYIEDQYFILVPELLDALLEVLPRLQRLIVVVQVPETDLKLTGYEKYLFDMIAPIQKLFPNKFQLYTTKSEKSLYIHSKLVIIDDVYLSIGSANWNRRGMTSDSEIGANVVDTVRETSPEGILVNHLARDYRLRKFQEVTGLSYEELDNMDFIDAANYFDVAVTDSSSILQVLEVQEQAYFVAYTDVVREAVDPQDTC